MNSAPVSANLSSVLSSVLITGAAGGIGRATALALAGDGRRIGLIDLLEAELERVSEEVAALGGHATVYPCSVTDGAGVIDLVRRHTDHYGHIDALVNAAGIGLFATVEETEEEQWRRILDVNLTGLFLMCRAVLPVMQRQGRGDIVNVISIAGKQAFEEQGAYCASKWGALGFTRVLARETRASGVRVTALCPGAVDTPFWDTVDAPFDRARMLRTEDVAATIRFILAQPPGIYIDEIELTPPGGVL